jgi:hypothetical protein
MPQKRSILGGCIVQRVQMLFGNDQYVDRSLRIQVVKSIDPFVLVGFF